MKIESFFFLWRWICSATEFLCLSSTIKLLLFSTMQSHIVHYFVHFVLPCRAGSALYANLSQDCLVYIRMEGTSTRRKLRSRSRSFWYLAFLFTLTCSQAVLAECKCTHVCDYQRAVERCAEKFVNFLFLSI